MNLFNILIILLLANYDHIYGFYKQMKIKKSSDYNIMNNVIKTQYSYYDNIQYEIIYDKYLNYALKKAIEFKNKYKINTKNNEEIYMYSKIGLYKAIINFDFKENTSFLIYSQKYINGELYNYISDKYPLSKIPSYMRRKNKYKLYPILIHNYWHFDKIYNNYNEKHSNQNKININEMWKIINDSLDSNSLLIFKNKYDYNFNIIHSNLYISKLFGFSEEYIRLNLNRSKNKIREKLEDH